MSPLKLMGMAVPAVFFVMIYAKPMSMSMDIARMSAGKPELEASLAGPALSDPQLEAARQIAIHRFVTAELSSCGARQFGGDADRRRDLAETRNGYYERNRDAVQMLQSQFYNAPAEIRLVTDFPDVPTYNDCVKLMRRADYKKLDIRIP